MYPSIVLIVCAALLLGSFYFHRVVFQRTSSVAEQVDIRGSVVAQLLISGGIFLLYVVQGDQPDVLPIFGPFCFALFVMTVAIVSIRTALRYYWPGRFANK